MGYDPDMFQPPEAVKISMKCRCPKLADGCGSWSAVDIALMRSAAQATWLGKIPVRILRYFTPGFIQARAFTSHPPHMNHHSHHLL